MIEDIVKKFVKYSPILVPVGLALGMYIHNDYKAMKNKEALNQAEYVAKPYKQNTSPK